MTAWVPVSSLRLVEGTLGKWHRQGKRAVPQAFYGHLQRAELKSGPGILPLCTVALEISGIVDSQKVAGPRRAPCSPHPAPPVTTSYDTVMRYQRLDVDSDTFLLARRCARSVCTCPGVCVCAVLCYLIPCMDSRHHHRHQDTD